MKKLLVFGVFAMVSSLVNASYLYWTVDNSYTMQNTGSTYTWSETAGGKTFQYGKVNALDSQGNVVYSSDKYGYQTDENNEQLVYTYDISSLANASSYSYSIELMAYDTATAKWGQIGKTGAVSYTSLVESGVILTGAEETLRPPTLATVQSVWHGAGVNAPEPTSAMLMLLGVAGLALRRKQRKIA